MKPKLLYFVGLISAGLLGYFLCSYLESKGHILASSPESSKSISNSQLDSNLSASDSISAIKSKLQDKSIVGLRRARLLHAHYRNFLKIATPEQIKLLFEYPIKIDSSRQNFMSIFGQTRFSHLRVYPGLNANNEMTLLFIGGKSDDTELIVADKAMVQDNNNPCKPCTLKTPKLSDKPE